MEKSEERFPLIIKGARQVGKTEAINHFAFSNYKSVVGINFALQKQYKSIFDDGFEGDLKCLVNVHIAIKNYKKIKKCIQKAEKRIR